MRYIKGSILVIFSLLLVFYAETIVFADTNASVSYASAVKIAGASVVNVFTDRAVDDSDKRHPHRHRTNLGSGVIIDKKGYVLTNYHVVRRAVSILVALDDGRRIKAKIVGVDQEIDLAVLHINLPNLHPATLGNSDNVQVGDIVLAIGNPFGLGQTVTQGIVSAMGRSTIGINQLEDYIQTDAAINPGNSGGALIKTNGKVIGINTGIYSRSGGYQGVGFAIPINVALNVMQQIIKTGSVKRGWLGVNIHTVASSSGVVIMALLPNSPAEKAGLKVGDVITYLNNQRIRTARGFLNYIAQRKPGSKVVIVYTRDHQTFRLEIKLGTRPPQPLIDDRGRIPEKPAAGSL